MRPLGMSRFRMVWAAVTGAALAVVLVILHGLRVAAEVVIIAFWTYCSGMRQREGVLLLVVLFLSAGVGYQAHVDAHALAGLDRTSVVPLDDGVRQLALTTGVLGGDPVTGCLWLEDDGGRLPLVLAHDEAGVDFTAVPPLVRTRDGVVARFGDAVSAGGGRGTAVASCASSGMPFRAWRLNPA